MSREEHQSNDFIPYPVNRVVGTITDSTQARATIEALLQRGVDVASIDVLYGDTGLHPLDPDGAQHGFWAPFQRTPATSSSWCQPATSERARKSPRR